jgi:hypothetical protein
MPVLVVFVDGIGVGADVPGNPFADPALEAIGELAGGRLVTGRQTET